MKAPSLFFQEKCMAMNMKYPFDMNWRTFRTDDLIKEALRKNHNDLDREDLIGLLEEVAVRLENAVGSK